jgi:hypothetical protein
MGCFFIFPFTQETERQERKSDGGIRGKKKREIKSNQKSAKNGVRDPEGGWMVAEVQQQLR